MKKFWEKFKIFWKELGNVLTNLLCPVMSILCAGAELLQLPTSVIQTLKKIEVWLFFACGTQKSLNALEDITDKALADDKITGDEVLDITEATLKITKDVLKVMPKEEEKREE